MIMAGSPPNLWRGSLLPLGGEAAPKTGPLRASGSKLPRHG